MQRKQMWQAGFQLVAASLQRQFYSSVLVTYSIIRSPSQLKKMKTKLGIALLNPNVTAASAAALRVVNDLPKNCVDNDFGNRDQSQDAGVQMYYSINCIVKLRACLIFYSWFF